MVLKSPDHSKPFSLCCDASDIGIGSVLNRAGSDGLDHPVSFFSKKLNKAQKNYSTIEKEALALLLSLKHFEVYLGKHGQEITVYTDNNPLTFVNKMKLQNQRLLRWSSTLQENNLKARHIKGNDNLVADYLSQV